MKFYTPYRYKVYVIFNHGAKKQRYTLVETDENEVKDFLNLIFTGNIRKAKTNNKENGNPVRLRMEEFKDRSVPGKSRSYLLDNLEFEEATSIFYNAVIGLKRGYTRLNELND